MFSNWIREPSFFTRRGAVCLWGGPDYIGVVKGGGSFFSVGQRGARMAMQACSKGAKSCLHMQRGRPGKIVDQPSQTGDPPISKK